MTRRVALADDGLERSGDVALRRLVARHDLELPAAYAGRDLQPFELDPCRPAPRAGSSRSPTPASRTAAAPAARRRSRPAIASAKAWVRVASSHSGWSSRGGPGQHDHRRAGAALRGRHDESGGGADRVEHRRPRRDHRLLAVGFADRLLRPRARQRLREASRIAAIRSSSAASSTISRPQKLAHDGCREIVRGRPQTAAGDDQRRRPARAPRSAASMSAGRSPTIVMCAEIDARARPAARRARGRCGR